MAKKKKKMVRPQYTAKSLRIKQAPKKPISKELKAGLIFCACALVLAVILFFALYDDGSLPLKDGKPVLGADNWLAVNTGTSSKPKYYKVGEVNPADGYTQDEETVEQGTMRVYYFSPEDAESRVTSYYVTAIARDPKTNAETAKTNYGMFGEEMEIGDVKTAEVGGTEMYYFTTVAKATEEAAASQQFIAYFAAPRDMTILTCINAEIPEAGQPMEEADMLSMMEEIVAGVTLDTTK